MRRIVVGVDGSQSSRNALDWAVREARAHGARVEAVHVWQVPAAAFYPPGAIALDVGTYEEQAKQQLDEIVDVARKHTDRVAERAIAIGVNPDGRCGTVARETQLKQLNAGYLQDTQVVEAFTDILEGCVRRMRERVDLLRGRLAAGPGPDGGWLVEAWLPLTGDEAGDKTQ